MSGTHGELFSEIGALVVAAHKGEPIDLDAKAEELAGRYKDLNVSAETITRAIARSASAVGVSMALVKLAKTNAIKLDMDLPAKTDDIAADGPAETLEKSPAILFPSGVRLAVLS